MKEKVRDLYSLTNVDYFNTYTRISRDTILKVAGSYTANAYWEKRKLIGDDVLQALDNELQKAYARCIYVQVLKVDLPATYENSIVNTQVEVQMTNMKQFEQTAELIRQGIDVIVSEAQQKIKVTNATAIAESYKLKQFAKARALNNTITTESDVYKSLKDTLQISNDDLPEYIFYNAIMDQDKSKLLVGIQNSIFNFANTPVVK